MQYANVDDLISKLRARSNLDATRELTKFFAQARFKVDNTQFDEQYSDRTGDRGIDFFHQEENVFYIFQTKFSGTPRNMPHTAVVAVVQEIIDTLNATTPPARSASFVNQLKLALSEERARLEIVLLTTDTVTREASEAGQELLARYREQGDHAIGIDFDIMDKLRLEGTINDVRHGYIPFTGKQVLDLKPDEYIKYTNVETNLDAYVCIVRIADMLRWFTDRSQVKKFVQKNVRDFLGEKQTVNLKITDSYKNEPELFWYKHNGIIIFANDVQLDRVAHKLTLRNPQIVNGAQTISALFREYENDRREENAAEILVRVYLLPYEHSDNTSLDIIEGLNSQNTIQSSDLKSNDPRQVRIQELMKTCGYEYLRKRSKENRASNLKIPMNKIALPYHIYLKNAPHIAALGRREGIFEDAREYERVFSVRAIERELNSSTHRIIDYITIWRMYRALAEIPMSKKKRKAYFKYSQFHILVDACKKLAQWRTDNFSGNYQDWLNLIASERFAREITKYYEIGLKTSIKIIPKTEKNDVRGYYRKPATNTKFTSKMKQSEFENLLRRLVPEQT